VSDDQPTSPQPEYLGDEPAPRRRPARLAALTGVSVAVVAAMGVGAWGVVQLMAGGTSPATAVPADAAAYLSLDLDPSASQKIEALRILKKFPALEKELNLGVRDDLRRWVFEQIQADGGCQELDYEQDIAPWLGDRMAVAAVPVREGNVAPLVVLQVSDQEAARAGVDAISTCADEDAAAGFVGDYMLVSEKAADVEAMVAAAEEKALADDADFTTWTDRLGDPGVVSAYVSADAPRLLAEQAEADPATEMTSPELVLPGGGPAHEQLRRLYDDFEGAAGVIRFADGDIEAEMVSRGLPAGFAVSDPIGQASLTELPATTAVALSVAFSDGWLKDYLRSVESLLSAGEEDFWAEGEAATGLQLPEDIETLLGDRLTLVLDARADLAALGQSEDVPDVPVGLRIAGDPAEIRPVLDKVLEQLGPIAAELVVEQTEDGVVVGLQREYVEEVVGGGDLGSSEAFRSVVPEADRASAVLFVDFDAEGWSERVGSSWVFDEDPGAAANVAPLDALGMSSWVDDDGVQHGLARLTTD
jgi:hypothetical protein